MLKELRVPFLFLAVASLLATPPGAGAAKSCPKGCTCVSNSFDRPDIETTVVDCSYQRFTSIPTTIPNSTTELFLQGSLIDTLSPVINSTAFTREGTPFTMPLTRLEILRMDKNPLTNISFSLLDHPNLAHLRWIYLPLGTRVLEQKPLKLVDHGIAKGWRALPPHPFENKDYMVWTREDYTPIINSGQNPIINNGRDEFP